MPRLFLNTWMNGADRFLFVCYDKPKFVIFHRGGAVRERRVGVDTQQLLIIVKCVDALCELIEKVWPLIESVFFAPGLAPLLHCPDF